MAAFFHRQFGEEAGRLYLAPSGPLATHRALARYFGGRADPASDGSWSGADARGFANLAYHLAQSAQTQALHRLLLDYRWLDAKLQRLGIAALLEDFSWVPLERSAALVGKALELSRNALATPRRHLASQLLGRLQNLRSPPIRVLRGHRGEVQGVAVTPDERVVVSCSSDALKLWDMRTGALIRTIARKGGLRAVAVTPDGRRVLVGTHDKTVEVWDSATGRRARPTLRGHRHAVKSVAISKNGRLAVTGSSDSTAKSWDLKTGRCLATFSGHTNIVRGVALSPTGRLAFSGPNDRTVRAWDPRTGVQKRRLAHDDFVFAVAASDDGHHLLTGAGDGTVRLWDLRTQERPKPLAAHQGFVYDGCFSATGGTRRLAAATTRCACGSSVHVARPRR